MARSKPTMTIGLLGTGKAPIKTTSQLIADLTGDAEVTLVVPITPAHFTPSIEAILEWAHDEGHKYTAVLDDTSADEKELSDFIDAAENTFKVAKVGTKIVNLLERASDGKLLMLWDDEDSECMDALERAVDREVPALDLTNALDKLVFDDPAAPADDSGDEVRSSKDDDDTPERTVASADDEDDDPARDFKPDDDLDSLGVRKLRDMVEEELGLSRRKVGQMGKPDCIAALREKRNGGTQEAVAAPDEEDGADEAQQPSRSRQRRAEREEEADDEVAKQAPATEQGVASSPMVSSDYHDSLTKQIALDFATRAGDTSTKTVERAQAYLEFLRDA